jgi:hypothetical protein
MVMADSDAAKLDELKRLLRRLDKALPQSLADETRARNASGTAGRGSGATALRTVVLAGGVSLVVSLGVAMLLIQDTPVRRFVVSLAPAKGAQGDAAQATGAQAPAVISETAALRAESAPRVQPEPPAAPQISREAGAGAAVSPDTPSVAAPEPEPPSPPMETGGVAAVRPDVPAPPGANPDPGAAIRADAERAALVELDADQFMRRGLLMLSRGSVSAAQLLLERAADLGSGEAAFALASTYDGAPGAPRHGPEVRPNADLAVRWYARAQELGVAEARKRLAKLKGSDAVPGQ